MMRPEAPAIPALFPATAAALARWDRVNRLSVVAAFLDSLSFVYLVPRIPVAPGSPARVLSDEAWSLLRDGLSSGRTQLVETVQTERERAGEALHAYEAASVARTFRLRLLGLVGGFVIHLGFLAAIASALALGWGDAGAMPVIALWGLVALGAGLWCRARIAPTVYPAEDPGPAD